MKPAKAMTIRLSGELAEQLETVADVENQPIAEVIRAAISEHIEHRKKDLKFKAGLRQRIESAKKMLEGNR